MRIRLRLESLRQSKWHEQLVRFALGGAITVATGLIAQHFGAVVGGLFLAFPAVFPASAMLVENHERERKRAAGIAFTLRGRLSAALDARGAVMGSLALSAFALLVWKFLPSQGIGTTLTFALAAWLLLAVLLWRLRKLHRTRRRN